MELKSIIIVINMARTLSNYFELVLIKFVCLQDGVCCPTCDVLPQRCQLLPSDETKPDQTDVLVESLETFSLDEVTAGTHSLAFIF